MTSLLSFPNDTLDAVPASSLCFLALRATDIKAEDLQALTPRLMLWEDDLWLLDLRPCLSYWSLQAHSSQLTLSQLLQRTLERLSLSPDYQGALAHHPWQAILLVKMLEKKKFSGLTTQSQRIGNNLLSSLSWDMWWAAAERYASHSTSPVQTAFPRYKRAMQLALRRLACDSPGQLKSMPVAQLRRRFGSLLAQLWEMTYSLPHSSSSSEGLWAETALFPWHPFVIREPLIRTRHLDFPLNDWQVLEPFLREDLNRFCVLDSFKKGERILNLEWRIVLYSLQEIPISVLFRHPHCLHSESPHQRTALLQIFYAFQQTMRSLRERHEEAPWIVSWELRILQTLRPLPQRKSLFADDKGEWEELLTLENQLDRPLEAYRVREDWVPEDSFALTSLSDTEPLEDTYLPPLHYLGRHRPLFLMQKPQPWSSSGQSLLWKFRERTMDKWWLAQGNTVRDYYQVVSQEQIFWIFRDAKGQCFLQGIYG